MIVVHCSYLIVSVKFFFNVVGNYVVCIYLLFTMLVIYNMCKCSFKNVECLFTMYLCMCGIICGNIYYNVLLCLRNMIINFLLYQPTKYLWVKALFELSFVSESGISFLSSQSVTQVIYYSKILFVKNLRKVKGSCLFLLGANINPGLLKHLNYSGFGFP